MPRTMIRRNSNILIFPIIFVMGVMIFLQVERLLIGHHDTVERHQRTAHTATRISAYRRSLYREILGVHIISKDSGEKIEVTYADVSDDELYRDVAVIVPYRNRKVHLNIFTRYMTTFLSQQNINYTIYVIEQEKGSLFNRAKLFNVGCKEAMKEHDYNCYIFHDVDLLPENLNLTYGCQASAVHMSVAIDTMNYSLPYKTIFGGVNALTPSLLLKTNGFSNVYWGWGGEDDDMSKRYTLLRQGEKRMNKDGLNSLEYIVLSKEKMLLYTHIQVDLMAPYGAREHTSPES